MMNPDPSEVTWRGALPFGPRRSLNRSSSGEPGGRLGRAPCADAFSVCVVAIFTTVGKSCADRSAKESGVPRDPADVDEPHRTSAARNAAPMTLKLRMSEAFPVTCQAYANQVGNQ